MQIYQGIQLVYTHVVQLIQSITTWFREIDWAVLVDQYPIQFQATISAVVLILLAMAAIGLVKKLSFLLG